MMAMREWAIAVERWRAVKFGDDPTSVEVSERIDAYAGFAKAVGAHIAGIAAAIAIWVFLL